MKQYLQLCQRIIDDGVWVKNERTGKRCKTIINADLSYNVGAGEFPLVTTRKSYYKAAIMELLGYLRGYNSAAQFRALGCHTWNSNANENSAWLANIHRTGQDDMGRVYGVQLRDWRTHLSSGHDQLEKVVNNLSQGIDDRGEILMMWNPGEFDLGCLRPCVYEHQFSILDGTLYLNSTQRSCDVPLGLNFNMVQCYTLLALMAQITGLKPGIAYHKIVNAHIYEDQLELLETVQMKREPLSPSSLWINPELTSLCDIEVSADRDDFMVKDYNHHPAIAYPFSV